MKGLWPRVRSAWKVLSRSSELDAEMGEEMRFHIEMEAERVIQQQGLDPQAARRHAHVRFGGLEKYKEQGRDARGRQWIDAMWLDARLGVRMLVKHRGLTLAGGFAMTVAIAIGATFFETVSEVLAPALPLEDGERVVGLQLATATPGSPERRVLHDFTDWRDELVSIEQVAAFRTVQLNLVSPDGPPEPIKLAEMTASGFAVARTPPLMGRYLLSSDERDGAPAVVVIGHEAWRSRFGGDPQVVGRTINIGGVAHTVVGVMPQGFAFPVNHHFWMPFRVDPLDYERLRGPELHMFGSLAPGVTMEQAQAELTIIGQRTAAAHPETYERLRPLVLPYTREHFDLTGARVWLLRVAQLLVGALVFVVSVNLAILFYARTVTRIGEIALRTALGATRRRILAQLFIEAFALTVAGAVTGLMLASVALRTYHSLIISNGSLPFWLDLDLSALTVIYAFGLAAVAAVVMGVLPGVKATGRQLHARLHELNGRSGTRLGPMWTTLVIAQIAVAAAVLPWAVYLSWQLVRMEVGGPGFAVEKFVVGSVAMSDETAAVDSTLFRGRQLALMSRLKAEPGVAAVTFSSGVPGFAPGRRIQFEAGAPVREPGVLEVSSLDVDLEMLDAYGAEMLAGRGFDASDLGANAAIVNRTFVQEFLDPSTRSALGLRFRYSRPSTGSGQAEWYQIVGVVRDFPSFSPAPGSDGEPTVYHPAAPGEVHPVLVSVRFSGPIPAGVAERFRNIGAEVAPALQLRRVVPLSSFYDDLRSIWRYLAWGIGLVTTSVLLLSAAGMYALMSFAVAQRTREIGIRSALGANPRRLLLSIFGRVIRQLGLGLLVGSAISGAVFLNTDLSAGRATTLLLTVAAIMLVVGLLAALGPARRSLRIQAIEALRTDG
jgi:putative ABC transport system permease protein